MKNLKLILGICLVAVAVFFTSCGKEEAQQLVIENTNLQSLVLENTIIDAKEDAITLNLSTEEFQQALDATFETKDYDIQKFFKNSEDRKAFRENIHQIFADNNIAVENNDAKAPCDHTYFAEAYSQEQGYTSSSSNSFAYAKRFGNYDLWASAFSCVTFDEVYTGHYNVCPYPNDDECMVRALYYGSGQSAVITGVSY